MLQCLNSTQSLYTWLLRSAGTRKIPKIDIFIFEMKFHTHARIHTHLYDTRKLRSIQREYVFEIFRMRK